MNVELVTLAVVANLDGEDWFLGGVQAPEKFAAKIAGNLAADVKRFVPEATVRVERVPDEDREAMRLTLASTGNEGSP